jgi:conjugative relaxase-like TrwC/TraI family protein
MLSIARMKGSSGNIAKYYKTGDYYTKIPGENDGWGGALAAELGLSGAVDGPMFEAILEGKVPGTDIQLGRRRRDDEGNIEIEHAPGWDFTFSAPKSVSMLIAAGDTRLMGLVEQAALWTMEHYLQQFAMTRTRAEGDVVTGQFLYAHFAELWSRDGDPAAHIHIALANMTGRTNGEGHIAYGSLETQPLYAEKMNAGTIFRAALAVAVREAGYDIVNDARTGLWDIDGIDKESLSLASKRANAIKAEAERRGDTSAETKAEIARTTRPAKEHLSSEHLMARFEAEHHASWESYQALIQNAKERGAEKTLEPQDQAKALAFGLAKSFERELVVEQGDVLRHGLNVLMGKATAAEMLPIIEAHKSKDDIITPDEKPTGGQTFRRPLSRDAFVIEEAKLKVHIIAGEGAVSPLLDAETAATRLRTIEKDGLTLSRAQYNLALKVLTSENRVEAVQGVPGAGKSYVVQAIARAIKSDDVVVLSSAPTATAAYKLGQDASTNQMTIAALLMQKGRPLKPGALLVVDEASMKSLRTANRLLEIVAERQARVLMIGDAKQLESVEAGKPFEIMQKMGMSLYTLNETHRHKDEETHTAIKYLRKGDIKASIDKLARAGAVIELVPQSPNKTAQNQPSPEKLRKDIIGAVLKHYQHDEHAPPSVIVLDNQTRVAINTAIRASLQDKGLLSDNKYTATVLINTGRTKVELKRSDHYKPGDLIEWHKDDKRLGVKAGTVMQVRHIDTNGLVLDHDGKHIDWSPRTGASRGAVSVNATSTRELAIGDKIQWRANTKFVRHMQTPLAAPDDPNRRFDALVPRKMNRISRKDKAEVVQLRNGSTGTVLDVQRHYALVRFDGADKKDAIWIDLHKNQHWDHGYAITTHKGQGSSIAKPIIVAPVTNSSLLSQSNLYTALTRSIYQPILITTDKSQLVKRIEHHLGKKTSPTEALNQLRPATDAEKTRVEQLLANAAKTKPDKANKPAAVKFEDSKAVKSRFDAWISTRLPVLVAEVAREQAAMGKLERAKVQAAPIRSSAQQRDERTQKAKDTTIKHDPTAESRQKPVNKDRDR